MSSAVTRDDSSTGIDNRQSGIGNRRIGDWQSTIEESVIGNLAVSAIRNQASPVLTEYLGPDRGPVLAPSRAMTPAELRNRLARYAEAVHGMCRPLLHSVETQDAARQLMRSAASAAANHRSAGRGRSHTEFTAKLGLALEECDESFFWLEHLRACGMLDERALLPALKEARELVAILTTSHQTAKSREASKKLLASPKR